MNDEIAPAAESQQDTEKKAGNALALRTAAMQELDAVEEGLSDLETKYAKAVFDTTETKGMEEAKAARAAIREPRYKAEGIRKEKTGQLAALRREINERAGKIKDRILVIEAPIQEQIKAEEDRKEAEREAKKKAEADRIAAINADLDDIRNMPLAAVGSTAESLQTAIDALTADKLERFDEAYLPTAQQTRDTSLEALRKMLAERQDLDKQQAELARLRQEQAQRDAEAEAKRAEADKAAHAERDRLAAEAQAKADQEAQERRQQQEREDAERAERQAAEDQQRAAQAEADRVERERVAAEQAERQRVLDQQAEEDRQAAAKAQQEAEDRKAAEEAAAAQRATEEAERAIAEATLVEAATEALDLLQDRYADHIATRKLAAALNREPQA